MHTPNFDLSGFVVRLVQLLRRQRRKAGEGKSADDDGLSRAEVSRSGA